MGRRKERDRESKKAKSEVKDKHKVSYSIPARGSPRRWRSGHACADTPASSRRSGRGQHRDPEGVTSVVLAGRKAAVLYGAALRRTAGAPTCVNIPRGDLVVFVVASLAFPLWANAGAAVAASCSAQ